MRRIRVLVIDLRDALVETARSRARGRVVYDGSGGSTYYPPGRRVRVVGDYVAFVGAWGYLLPAAGTYSLVTRGTIGYPAIYPGIDPRLNLAILALVPMFAFPFVAIAVLHDRFVAKLALVVIGLLGAALTWPMNEQIYGGSASGAGPLIGLSAGSWVILFGGFLGLAATYYGEWAKQYDDDPRTVSR